MALSQPARVILRPPGKDAYWIVAEDGGVFAKNASYYGGAVGSMVGTCVGACSTPSGNGYALIGSAGNVYCYGDAGYYGGGANGARSIQYSPSGLGYWIVHSDGAVWSMGDAVYHGNAP